MARETWADTPFELVPLPERTPGEVSHLHLPLQLLNSVQDSHAAIDGATEMAHLHNCLLRGLNSVYLQAPKVSKESDVKDLLFYVTTWTKLLHHHHHEEETFFFPSLEKLAKDPNLMQDSEREHREFAAALATLQRYAEETDAEAYRWEDLKRVIDDLVPSLKKHLYNEIKVLQNLQHLDSVELRKCMEAATKMAIANSTFQQMV